MTENTEMERHFAADYELVAGEGGVDQSWYLQTYADIGAAGADPVAHYLQQGWREGRDPRPDFSTTAYLRVNNDVEGNPLVHYLRNVRPSGGAATPDWYLLWKKGYLHLKGGQEFSPNAGFGSPDVPKILFAGHEASRSGAPLILLRLMQAVQNMTGSELYLILERDGPLLEDYQRIAHVLVNQAGMLYWQGGKLARMLRSIAAPRPEIAICNCADAWRLVGALRAAGIPRVVSLIHERVVHYPSEVWRSIHQHSDRVVFPANAVKAVTAAAYPEFQDACVLPQGLLNPDFGRGDRNAARRYVRDTLGLASDAVIVLGCGSQDMRKGLDLFVQLAARVRARSAREVHFVRKGVDLFVQLAARVRARSAREVHFVWLGAKERVSSFAKLIEVDISLLNLKPVVTLLDEVSDPEPYFLAADCFALTSRDDPFPCVVHEAMACGLPIVAFDGAGGAKEAILDDCGIVVPYLDVEAMARALISAIEDPERSGRMGRRAQSRVRSVYRFSEYAQRIWDLCESLKSRSAGQARASAD